MCNGKTRICIGEKMKTKDIFETKLTENFPM